jgi:hypothetical protein
MTEKQGGSDVRCNTMRASRMGDGTYELLGHKFFFSAPTAHQECCHPYLDGSANTVDVLQSTATFGHFGVAQGCAFGAMLEPILGRRSHAPSRRCVVWQL